MSETSEAAGVYLTRDELARHLDESFLNGSEAALETVLDCSYGLRGRLRMRHNIEHLLATVRADMPPATPPAKEADR